MRFIREDVPSELLPNVNPSGNILILYLLKTPENQRFAGVFTGYKMGSIGQEWVKIEKVAYFRLP